MAKAGPESELPKEGDPKHQIPEETKINASQAEVFCNSGLVQLAFGRYKEAIKYFDKALEANPRHAEASRVRRFTQEKLGQDPGGGTFGFGIPPQEPGLVEESPKGIKKLENPGDPPQMPRYRSLE